MGKSTREEGVLKLVHPGRHVETYTEPIIAAEVLKKYPRHCIARPDVFKFPWIVVRPEAVLYPGKVFYIVPQKTTHDLLKAKRQQNQHMPLAIPSLNSHDDSRDFNALSSTSQNSFPRKRNSQYLKNDDRGSANFLRNRVNHSRSDWSSSFEGSHHNSPRKSTAGMTPKHYGHGKHHSSWFKKDDYKENMDNQPYDVIILFIARIKQLDSDVVDLRVLWTMAELHEI